MPVILEGQHSGKWDSLTKNIDALMDFYERAAKFRQGLEQNRQEMTMARERFEWQKRLEGDNRTYQRERDQAGEVRRQQEEARRSEEQRLALERRQQQEGRRGEARSLALERMKQEETRRSEALRYRQARDAARDAQWKAEYEARMNKGKVLDGYGIVYPNTGRFIPLDQLMRGIPTSGQQ